MAGKNRKRQAAREAIAEQEQRKRRLVLIATVVALPVALGLFGIAGWNHLAGTTEFTDLVAEGQPTLAQVHREPSRGREHVRRGTPVAADREFPLSGTHWPTWVDPGYYEAPQAKGELIHSLEHGMVIIYYDEMRPETESRIRSWTRRFSGDWSGVLAVPHPGVDEGFVLTAWQHRLDLEGDDPAAMAAFIDAYRGRGPENPIR